MKEVVVVDYGIGNLLSVARALEHVGAKAVLSSDFQTIVNADRLILPGVGAFGHCMKEIRERKLIEPIQTFIQKQRPLLGICVGMQVLHTVGMEFGKHAGLSLIDGVVDKIPNTSRPNRVHKIPYVGWAKLTINSNASHPFIGALKDQWFYFVHGFMATPSQAQHVLAYYQYNDVSIAACTAKGNIMGVQFHPEKSAQSGLKLLEYFCNYSP